MEIIEAQITHLPKIVELKLLMFEEAGLGPLLPSGFKSLVLSDYLQLYKSSNALHFLAIDDGDIVSMVGGFIKSDIPYRYYQNSRYGFVGDVYTLPTARGQGVATALNRRVLRWLKMEGMETVRLQTTDAGRPIYESFGFRPSNEMVLTFRDED